MRSWAHNSVIEEKTVPDLRNILEQIEQLSDEQRLTLERKLAQRTKAEWRLAVRDARRLAKQRHIGEAEIDATIERRRYGR